MNDIAFTRGDSKVIIIDVVGENGADYEPAVGDEIVMTVRNSKYEIVIEKKSGDADVIALSSGWQINLQPTETADLPYGNYMYDIQVTLADGYVQTIIPLSWISLTQEVTYTEVTP